MTFEEFLRQKDDFEPTALQLTFVRLVDNAVRGGYPLHRWPAGMASGKTTLLREMEEWWKGQHGN